MAQAKHRYFIAWPDSSSPLVELDGPVWTPVLPPETRYPLAVLAAAEAEIHSTGLHFYLTKDPDRLPEYGPHVVAVLLQEERCKIPTYARGVRAVMRNLQAYPYIGFRPHGHMGRLEGVLFFEYLRDWALHLRSQSRAGHFVPVARSEPLIMTIPLGYHSQEELPLVPMQGRTLDTFFAGDVHAHFAFTDYRHWVSTSKIEARRQCWEGLEALKRTQAPDGSSWNILVNDLSADRAATDPSTYSSYSQRMQQSRICLAPRGSVAETFRFYEGLRAGCLVITNRLPSMPFLDGAPVLMVDHWRELPELFQRYARNRQALDAYSTASRKWWDDHCSESVRGNLVARALNATQQIT